MLSTNLWIPPSHHTCLEQKNLMLIFNVTNQEGSVLLCCEDVPSLELITPKDGLEEMEDEATLISNTVISIKPPVFSPNSLSHIEIYVFVP